MLEEIEIQEKSKKGKAIPVNRLWRPIGLWELKLPYFLDNQLTHGGVKYSVCKQLSEQKESIHDTLQYFFQLFLPKAYMLF
jgi:hypothetical protein